jgi:hypothetical protein
VSETGKVKINGVEHALSDLTEAARAQLVNLQFVDAQLQQLRNELAIADTARIAYATALKRELASTKA